MADGPEETPLSEQHHQVVVHNTQQQVVSPDDQVPITKEEEWIKRKKVEVVTKRQIATRVQREVVLEDGKVVQDSGPKVTTTTTEDTEKQELENTEHHDILPGDGAAAAVEGWVSAGEPSLLSEVSEKKVTTRQEKQETVETEDIKHLGDISDEAYRKAIESGDVGEALVRAPGLELATIGPRVVNQTTTTHTITDTENTLNTTGVDSTGKIVTNSFTKKEHEEVREEEVPNGVDGEGVEEFKKEKSHHYSKTKDQEFVDYVADGVKIGTEMRYNAETTQGTRLGEGEWDSLSERLNKMRRGRFLKESLQQDRKDALTRCPLDFDQEEKTRKAETSKWLEHHFGSESNSRSSRDSDDEGPGRGHQTGYINVTMKSAKEPNKQSQASTPNGKGVFLSSPEPEKVYFKGISEWKSEERKYPVAPPARGVQVLPTGPNHTFNANSVPVVVSSTKPPTPPLAVNGGSPHHRHHHQQQHVERTSHSSHSPLHHQHQQQQHHQVTKSTKYYERNCSPYERGSPMYRGSSSPVLNKLNGKASPPTREHTPPTVSPPHRRRTRRSEREEEPLREEPAPDYSPVSEPRSSPHRITPEVKRKVYQRTRFAADIPPPSSHHHHQQYHNHHQQNEGKSNGKSEGKRGGLGQSFRRLVGKLRSASGERNGGGGGNKKNKGNSKKGGGDNSHHHQHQEEVGVTRVVDSGTQTGSDMHSVHRLYLGHEQPFAYPNKESSDYELGYRRKYRREEDRQHSSSQGSSTLGRLSKSTGRLSSGISSEQQRHLGQPAPGTTVYYNDRGGVQTLPRKLQEHKHKKEVQVTRSSGESSLGSGDRYTRLGNNSSSMFNVSIVNNVSSSGGYHQANGTPVKPARAYKSNLLRSKSFNVHAGEPGHYQSGKYTSNPHLHRLDESHAPLKSPGIVTSISRSTRDISEALHEEDERPGYEHNRYAKANGFHSRSNVDSKKKMLMKQLMDRAPDLYRSFENDERTGYTKNGFGGSSPTERLISFGSGSDLTRRVVRRGSNDYTETVSYTNKSDDPGRPTVTNTVQSFTKKTIPTAGGHRKETIESTETKTITKSRFRTGTPDLKYLDADTNKYSTSNGGVIIEVRNTRK